ncbi:MAG: response regulator transcription factor [Chloroflexi bacterium]|nr:response regulator transcription factor [Chloroflexota bacterium]MBF6614604.1 response regulator transcription factor [Chloroflexota bacterium]
MTGQMTLPVPINLERARIFVADDDSSIAALMQDLLQGEAYSVTLLQHAKNVYEEIVQTLPDLAILDITLERQGDGWLALDKLRHNPKTACMPAIICSADMRGLRARQESLSAMGCLVIEKPFDIDALLAAVRESLGGGSKVLALCAKPNKADKDTMVLDVVGAYDTD